MSLRDVNRSRAGWWALGALIFGAFLYVVYSFIGTFVFGIFIYYATRPIYRRLRRRIRPPSLAAAVAIFALALPALALVAYALVIVFRELSRLTGDGPFDLTQYPGISQELLNTLANPRALVTSERVLTAETLQSLVSSVSSAADALTFFGVAAVHLFVMVALAFYLLRDDHRLARWGISRFSDADGVLESYVRAVDSSFNSIFFGNILNAVLTGTIGVLAYTVLNVFAPPGGRIPAAALVGLLAGVASLIPVVGMKLVYFPVAGYMTLLSLLRDATSELWFVGAFVAVSFVIVDTIPDLILRPYVSGRRLHVGSVMLAYTLGPLLFGWYGIFLMPMLLVLLVHFVRLVLPELLAGRPIRPYSVDPGYLIVDDTEETREDGAGTVMGDDA